MALASMLGADTLKHLETEKKRLEREISGLEMEISDLEEAIDAIDTLLGGSKPESAPGKTLKSMLKADKTFRSQVTTTVMYMDRPVRPVEVADELGKTGLFEEKNLKGKTATEMFKLAGDKMRVLINEDGMYRLNPELKR